MKMLLHLLPIALACAAVTAQGETIIDSISSFPELSTFTSHLKQHPDIVAWFNDLQNVTLLAPINSAFALPLDPTQTLTEALLSYHVLDGTYFYFSEDYEYLPTALQASKYAPVTGGQIVIANGSPWTNLTTFYSGLHRTSSTTGPSFYFSWGIIHLVDNVLTLPQNLTTTAASAEMHVGASAFSNAAINSPDTTNVDQLSNVTIFLPIDYNFEEIGSVISKWTKADLSRVMSYHIIDQVLNIDFDNPPLGRYTTLEGSELSINSKDGFAFVNNAQIVGEPEETFAGGRVYSIYGVLNPDNSTVTPDITDSGIAFADASYSTDFVIPGNPSHPASNRSGLSTGAKAGIGAGVAVGVVLLILASTILAFRCLRRRNIVKARQRERHQEWYEATKSSKHTSSGSYDLGPIAGRERF